MRALCAILLLLAVLVLAAGCVTTSRGLESPGYYSRGGSIHSDSFPPDYNPGRVPGWGSRGGF
jgi:hypothetical protein